MGDKVALTVEERNILGKKVKQLRKRGLIPAVVYGNDVEATAIQAEAGHAQKVWQEAGRHQVVELTLGGKKHLAMIKTADIEPVKRRLRHLSLHVVKQNEKVETEVAVRVTGEGETPAEKAGLVILKNVEAVQISALPKDLPEYLGVPGDKLAEAGDHLTVADITPVSGVTVLSDPAQTVVTVYEPSALAAANDATGGDASEEDEVPAENGAEASAEGEENPEAAADNKK